jgi:hypothetical protein
MEACDARQHARTEIFFSTSSKKNAMKIPELKGAKRKGEAGPDKKRRVDEGWHASGKVIGGADAHDANHGDAAMLQLCFTHLKFENS